MQKIKVFLILTSLLIFISAVGLSAQSMNIIDDLLDQEVAEYGEAVYLITVGSGAVNESASISEAMSTAAEEKWISKRADADDSISLGEVSYIIMKSLKIRGGLMYKLFPSPRYAVRELAYLEIVTGQAHPGDNLSGEDVMNILSRAIDFKEGI
ncbi:MAG: hypothetical protein PQJ61_11400 [Spirochaetales bacterium]|uniref:Uncharacterized protein n=1 Tax=Candidatus Thalassospirochaeta sargassi TaxID=3119039 RepID=A0AAJ1MK75_9SPIO|nr:hypothetical protein [Spirochaetales bacterium]